MNARHRFLQTIFVAAAGCLIAAGIAHTLMAQSKGNQPLTSDRVLVAFLPGTGAAAMSEAHSQAAGKVIKKIERLGVEVIEVPAGTAAAAIEKYRSNSHVRFAEPDFRRTLFRPATNEGSEPTLGIGNLFTEQWGLDNTGQSFGATIDPIWGTLSVPAYTGAAGADIDAPEGWALTHGSSDVNIAILDSGVSCSHADLASKCVEQVNFVADHGSPIDDVIGHGTHVAGIAAAETDNGIGVAGVAWNASIGSMKVCYEDYTLELLGIIQGYCDDDDVAAAIVYAADAGYQVINMSLAGPEFSTTLQDAVDYAWQKGTVLVAGAGNDYTPVRQYPAAYDNVIGVAATDYFDNLAYFSSFSKDEDDWVSVAAPGHTILSTVPGAMCGIAADDRGGCYDWKSGTSMATPYVSGVAAMLWSYLPDPTAAKVRENLENGADKVGALGQNFLAWTKFGRVNLHDALAYAGPVADTVPPVISDVGAVKSNGFSFQIRWRTDEPATSVLSIEGYGEVRDDALVTDHVLTYRGKKGVTYQYSVSSTDAAGNTATAGPFSFNN